MNRRFLSVKAFSVASLCVLSSVAQAEVRTIHANNLPAVNTLEVGKKHSELRHLHFQTHRNESVKTKAGLAYKSDLVV
jgi:hypothetical protein